MAAQIVPTLKADLEFGEGKISFPKNWHQLSGLMRKDLLKDWICDLQQEYDGLTIRTKPGVKSTPDAQK